jgi:hypothetical protein
MSRPGACELGCGEERKLELVDAYAHDQLEEHASAAQARCVALRALAVRLASEQPGPGEWEHAYRSLQQAARSVLGERPPEGDAEDEPAAIATTWWCPRCGGIDAPQPCIGVCVWRPVEWVRAEDYEAARARARAAHVQERALRSLLGTLATVTPRAGHWERGWHVLACQARDVAVP